MTVQQKLFTKPGRTFGLDVQVEYFAVDLCGGEMNIQNPDQLIREIAWKTANELIELELSFPEDRDFLIHDLQSADHKKEL